MTATDTEAQAGTTAKGTRTRRPSGTDRPNVTVLPAQLAPLAVRVDTDDTYNKVYRGRSGKEPKQMWLRRGEATANMIAALIKLPEAADVLARAGYEKKGRTPKAAAS